ncbi:EboA family metabolite traffic protein [Gloeocapsopsis dulcis]|uniref:EboA family metabolite traffic protein n=1 Tax=Gloeocapsopsis dulcis AAB1 = 1H9 TaxID=1433147 RepID=A0A6N8FUM3_9CHRO|nr:EboA family metabolite traffic protein [Gloeocapsopsis dulcis]MUL35646.1 hypothetical protein [Gloeocapsopsis dulcis AAB1 = 1H9]WNN87454.1 EboA family metabolite traffic protein [Gloeocapsopsis dulcis]
MKSATNYDLTKAIKLLHNCLSRQISHTSLSWLEEKRNQIAQGATQRVFYTTFSAVPRYLGKKSLTLSAEDLLAADTIRAGWNPQHWSVDQAGRTLVVLSLPHIDVEKYLWILEQVFTTADVRELIALYQSLPLLSYPEKHCARAAEGVRSNMTNVFNAVALRNPYPADYFDDLAWNQMILKAVFVGSPLYLVQGGDRRANPELAKMLVDYARERWAAKRSVTPELWRFVGYSEIELQALARVLRADDIVQQEAAALACAQSPLPQAQELLAHYPDLQAAIHRGDLTWSSFNRDRLSADE